MTSTAVLTAVEVFTSNTTRVVDFVCLQMSGRTLAATDPARDERREE